MQINDTFNYILYIFNNFMKMKNIFPPIQGDVLCEL